MTKIAFCTKRIMRASKLRQHDVVARSPKGGKDAAGKAIWTTKREAQ